MRRDTNGCTNIYVAVVAALARDSVAEEQLRWLRAAMLA
jgi:hypothetical protein